MVHRRPTMLVWTPIYPWPGNPSEGIFVHRQVLNLQRLGHRVRVINFHPAVPRLPHQFVTASWLRYHPRWITWPGLQDGVQVDHVFYAQPVRGRSDAIIDATEAVSRHIDRTGTYHDTDLVYAHWLWKGGAVALELRARYGWPTAAIARGSEMHRWQSDHPHCRPYVDRVLCDADLVLANCNALRESAASQSISNSGRIRVAYNGCNPVLFRPATDRAAVRLALGFAENRKYFVCCATIAEHKGIRDLARAWRKFAVGHPAWRLLVLGPFAQRALATSFQDLAGNNARLLGQVASTDVVRYLQAADAYVQPSRLEGLSNATMEAMATALPVVTTDAGGQVELVRDGLEVWLVPAEDPDALARAMAALASDPAEALRRGAAARRSIVERFDAMHETEKLSNLLTDLHTSSVLTSARRFEA